MKQIVVRGQLVVNQLIINGGGVECYSTLSQVNPDALVIEGNVTIEGRLEVNNYQLFVTGDIIILEV